jgi:hypothetical protein
MSKPKCQTRLPRLSESDGGQVKSEFLMPKHFYLALSLADTIWGI